MGRHSHYHGSFDTVRTNHAAARFLFRHMRETLW